MRVKEERKTGECSSRWKGTKREIKSKGGNESKGEDMAVYASLLSFGGNAQRELMHKPGSIKTYM